MAAEIYVKKDLNGTIYCLNLQRMRDSVRSFHMCNCYLNQINYTDLNVCLDCGQSRNTMNWDKISEFMETGSKNIDEISRLINKNRLSPFTKDFAKYFSLNEKEIKNFNRYQDTNAFVVAQDSNKKYYLYMFTKYDKNINYNNITYTIDEIELCLVNIIPNKTILTPNWNYDFNPWLTSKKKKNIENFYKNFLFGSNKLKNY